MYSDEVAILPDSLPRYLLNEPTWRPRPPPRQEEPGLPPDPDLTFGRPDSQRWGSTQHAAAGPPRFVSHASRGRHVTFSSQEPHLDKATGNIEHVCVPQAAESQPRLPRSISHMPSTLPPAAPLIQYDDKATAQDSEEEHFVDGSYFFNHLVRNKEAEDYNMAEMLRQRSRELQRRRLFGREVAFRPQVTFRRPRPDAAAERLSTSLPADYFVAKPAGYYCYRDDRSCEMPLPPPRQDTRFADGLEIEIPPRRHGGLGGGGLRQSLSADRLLMVPPTHRDSSRYGRHYFGPGLTGENPSSYSSANLVPGLQNPRPGSASLDQDRTQHAKQAGYVPRFGKPGSEPVTNRYNVRTGRFEPDVETPPKLPPKVAPPPKPPKLGPIRYESDEGPVRGEEWDNRRNADLSANHGYLGKPPVNTRVKPSYRVQDPNRTWNAQTGVREHPDPRLSVSFDPARFRGPDYHAQNVVNTAREAPRQPGNPNLELQPYRKGVTWRDQDTRGRSNASNMNLSRTHPGGSFQENLGYEDQESSKDDTRSTFREGVSYPSNDSLLRSLAVNDLQNVDQFALFEVSTSKLNWAESFMGTNLLDKMTQYKFVVLNRHEEVLFFGAEDELSISNCILSPQKSSFKVRILDANGQDFVHFRRLYPVKPKTNLTIGNKKKYRLEVATPSGHVIGNVEKTYNSDTYYILEDRAGACLFLVQRSCICTCPLFWDYEFKILMPEGDAEVGEISWSYLTAQDEQFNGTEISFPIDLNTTSKIMLLGVCFLLNFSRWQSAYLDSMHNPRVRKSKAKQKPGDESREVTALLKTNPEDHGFHDNEEVGEPGAIDSRGAHGRNAVGDPS